jgi:uncharacterized membrane protein HdeD (DUF308 family)
MTENLAWRWWGLALRGVAAVALGVISLFMPEHTLPALVVVFGCYAIVDGVLALAIAVRGRPVPTWAAVARGVASIFAGAVALAWPGITTLALLLVIAAWAAATGAFAVVSAVRLRRQLRGEWLLVLEGVLSVVFGIALVLAPAAGAIALGLWIGIYALVLGGLLIATALDLRSRYLNVPPAVAGT